MLGADDPVRAFWDLIGRGQSVLAVGQDVDRWRAASELTLRANAWRLPLHSLLEYLRWYTETDKEGAVVLRRSGQIPFTREGDGQAHLSDVVMHWLELFLTASTGTKRRKRGLSGDHGNIGQRFKGMIHLSAISRPVRADLQRRALIVRHDKRFRNEGHRSAEVIAEFLRQRSAAWSGIAELYAHRIMPRLAQKDHARFADRISPDHPVEGMREALGVMALIADVLCREEPLWGISGDRLLDDWLALTGRHIHAIRGSSDPIAAALDELLVQWNRLVEDGPRRPPRPPRALLPDRRQQPSRTLSRGSSEPAARGGVGGLDHPADSVDALPGKRQPGDTGVTHAQGLHANRGGGLPDPREVVLARPSPRSASPRT